MSEPKHPLKPSELGTLYPQAKTYDELQADRAEIRRLRRSWQPKHPKLLIAAITITLIATFWLIVMVTPPLAVASPMLGVPLGILAATAWVLGLLGGVRKMRELLGQIAFNSDDQSDAGASRDQQ